MINEDAGKKYENVPVGNKFEIKKGEEKKEENNEEAVEEEIAS